jgi:hypothetical protein
MSFVISKWNEVHTSHIRMLMERREKILKITFVYVRETENDRIKVLSEGDVEKNIMKIFILYPDRIIFEK